MAQAAAKTMSVRVLTAPIMALTPAVCGLAGATMRGRDGSAAAQDQGFGARVEPRPPRVS
jgi:hypothetical protein